MTQRNKRDSGFSILEMLVAITVISVGLWGIMDLVFRDGHTLKRQEVHLRAVLIGESLLSYWERTGSIPEETEPQPVPQDVGIGPCYHFTWAVGNQSEVHPVKSVLIYFNHRQVLAIPFLQKREVAS